MANESLLTNAAALGAGAVQTAAAMLKGGQLGAGFNTRNLDASTPLTFTPTVLVVLQIPTMYVNRNEDSDFGKTLKALIETHAKQVTGIDFGYTLEVADQPFGHDGQNIQVPTQTKRSAVNPSFVFHELKGNLVWNLFNRWVRDIQDPDTNASMARLNNGAEPLEFVSSTYSMTMLALQFDPTMHQKRIIDAAVYTNMFPTDPGGQIGFERTIGTTNVRERTVTFSAIVLHNDKTREVGQKVAESLQIGQYAYDNVAVTPDTVSSNLANTGLSDEISKILNQESDA